MSDNKKFDAIIKEINDIIEDGFIEQFDKRILNTILELEDKDKTSKYDFDMWKKQYELYAETQSTPLAVSLIKAKGIPPLFLKRIMNNFAEDKKFFVFLSEDITMDIIEDLFDSYSISEMKEIITGYGSIMSQKSIELLCNLNNDILKEFDFSPYEFVKNNSPVIDLIEPLIDDEDGLFFDGEIPEAFSHIVADNPEIPHYIRNKAFDTGYDASHLHSFTLHMLEEVYKSCCDTLFNVTPTTAEDISAKESADLRLCYFMLTDQFPENYQYDFINRMKDFPNNTNSMFYRIVTDTKYPSILKEAVKIPRKDIFLHIAQNVSTINCDVVKTALDYTSSRVINRLFVTAIFNDSVDKNLYNIFKPHNEISYYRALLASSHTPDIIAECVIKDTKKSKYANELNYLYTLRNGLKDNINDESYKKIINTATMLFIKNDDAYKYTDVYVNPMTSCSRLYSELTRDVFGQWFVLNKKEIELFKNTLSELSDKYPEFKNSVTNILYKNLNKLEKNQKIVIKYPELFKVSPNEKKAHRLLDVPFTHFLINNFKEMEEDKKREFLKDIEKCKNMNIIDILRGDIEDEINLYAIEGDKLYKNVYYYADLFNSLKVAEDKVLKREKMEDEIEL